MRALRDGYEKVLEWIVIARDFKQGVDADPQRAGGSSVQDRDAYYRDKGYCVETKRYGGSPPATRR